MSGLIAIVGRPNVGKSALFNRIVGRRLAIVHDQPGVTRDRISAPAEFHGRPLTLVDTGGIGLLRGERTNDPIAQAAFTQVTLAIESADVIILVVNLQEGLVPLDREVAQRLRKSGKPVVLAANKADSPESEAHATEFNELGFDSIYPVSAIHARGIEELVAAAVGLLPAPAEASGLPEVQSSVDEKQAGTKRGHDEPRVAEEAPVEAAEPGTGPEAGAVLAPAFAPGAPLKIAIVGRPNVGKSSLINALTNSERVIVSPIPGTTRDAVDVPFEVETEGRREKYVLIDTAGLRKTRRVDDSIEFFSVKRAEESIERADLVILVLDAEMGVTEQDKKIGDRIVQARRACLIVVNKWDLYVEAVAKAQRQELARQEGGPRKRHKVEADRTSLSGFGRWVQETLFFLDYAPVLFTSAKTGFHLDRLLEAVRFVTAELTKHVPTALLNRTLTQAIERKQPVSALGHHLKFFYATQVRRAPPTFLLFVNRDGLFSDQYTRFLTAQMRKAFGYEGCPIVLVARARPKKVESFHRGKEHTATPQGRPAQGGRRAGAQRPARRPAGERRPTRRPAGERRPSRRPVGEQRAGRRPASERRVGERRSKKR